jgi:NDP-sugar pyrophosphorylase family protein
MISEKGDEYWFQMGKLQGFIQANEILSSRAYPHNTDVRPTIKSIQVDIQQWISYLRELLGYENEISEVNK